MTMGHEEFGSGRRVVIVLNDWMCDTSTWDGARAYLDRREFTWVFADLRGYGRSRGQTGEHTLREAAADVLALADARAWDSFAIVGHSMSSLVALHLAQHHPDRIDRTVVLTPPPPSGFGADASRLQVLRELACGDDSRRLVWLRSRSGDRLSEGWARFKVDRWRSSADPNAVAEYAAMFACRGLPDPVARIAGTVLAVTGEQDIEIMRHEAVAKLLAPLCPRLLVIPILDCGHYPMQENPPRLVAIVERFLVDVLCS